MEGAEGRGEGRVVSSRTLPRGGFSWLEGQGWPGPQSQNRVPDPQPWSFPGPVTVRVAATSQGRGAASIPGVLWRVERGGKDGCGPGFPCLRPAWRRLRPLAAARRTQENRPLLQEGRGAHRGGQTRSSTMGSVTGDQFLLGLFLV